LAEPVSTYFSKTVATPQEDCTSVRLKIDPTRINKGFIEFETFAVDCRGGFFAC
jgi:hypothetical protein